MLDVDHNRLDYGRLLIPPDGYRLSQAVATSYSVDLDTLLSIPVALYYAQTLEGELQGKDIQLIRAIQHTAKLLTIYHQAGQVRVPPAAKDIYAYFENSLVPITPWQAFASFHPKTWMLRFEHTEQPDEVIFRLIVLSRNLTFDRSWDVAACLEGKPEQEPLEWNQPLVDFHGWLHQQRPLPNGQDFLDELARVDFKAPKPFYDYAFHPIGIPGYAANPVASHRAERLLCLSPFLHPKALGTLWENVTETPQVLSRHDELERLIPDFLGDYECYCLPPHIVDGERLAAAEEGDGEPCEQDLHAKAFLFDERDTTTWFIGSANATKAAFEQNVEFLLELHGSDASTRLSSVRKQLLGNDITGALFVPFEPFEGGKETPEEAQHRSEVRKLEYALLKAEMSGKVTRAENQTNYDLTLTLDLQSVVAKEKFRVNVCPFVRGVDDQALTFGVLNVLSFPNISETSLSRFLHFTLYDGEQTLREFLIRVKVDGIPETRLDNIFRSIIDSREKFFTYLRFLLTDELSKEDLEADPPKKNDKGGRNVDPLGLEMPVFEQLLVTASRNPRRLLEVERVIRSLNGEHGLTGENGEVVIPEDFLSLWAVFKAAVSTVEDGHE